MAMLKVGMRVRVVRVDAKQAEWLLGSTGTVVPHDGKPGRMGNMYDYDVALDRGLRGTFNAHHLEPIQPERNRTTPWSECLWMPPHMKETA